MSITRTARLAESDKTSVTTWTTTGTVTASTGDTIVVSIARIDTNAGSNASVVWNTSPSQSATGAVAKLGTGGDIEVWYFVNVTGGTGTLTITFPVADAAHAVAVSTLTSPNGAPTFTGNATSNNATGTAVTSGSFNQSPNSGCQVFWLGAIGVNGPSGDTAPTWTIPTSAGQRAGTTGGSDTTVDEGFEIDSSSLNQGLDATLGTSRPWAAIWMTFLEPVASAAGPTLTLLAQGVDIR